MSSWLTLVGGLAATSLFLALAIWGWGDWAGFWAHPARVALILSSLIAVVAFGFSGSRGFSTGRREAVSNRWIFLPLTVLTLALGWLPAHTDRLDRWTIDGDATRYTGLAPYLLGGTIRLASVFALGHRFSALVAVQTNHALKTDGIYGFVRHPSYLGALLAVAGWSLVFRSALGLLLTFAMLLPILGRIRAEEHFLEEEFGDAYVTYTQDTPWRLVPGVY
jgi:protein-S-isoprenylcysteine O-methyltransferase Ste14